MSSLQGELQPSAPEKLVLRGVGKGFPTQEGTVRALDRIDLQVAEGEFVVIVGPSGCGKSTLLSLVAGLDRADEGEILADGVPVTGPGRDRMIMFQEAALFPWRDALGNVEFGLELKPGLDRRARAEVAAFFLRLVGLERFRHSWVHELSGGMKQRVALARSLAANPRVLLMDEPFAALDAMTREQLYGDLERIWSERRKTILFVTHNVREAVCLADRVLLMTPHPGRVQEGFPIDLPRPRDINSPELAARAGAITRALRTALEPATRDGMP
ncbi:MAG: ABC transporter ATP-binding protein [Planctomycetes bacterium]|nr:ABC transporter ATP-binding protein [Planctomycetota bacterium]